MKDWLKAGLSIIGGYLIGRCFDNSNKSSRYSDSTSIFRDLERVSKDYDNKNYFRLAEDFVKAADKLGIMNNKRGRVTNYAELLNRRSGITRSHATTNEEQVEELNQQISEIKEKMSILRANKPRRFFFANRRGIVDKDSYNEDKKEWNEIYNDLKTELKEAKKELKDLQKEIKDEKKAEAAEMAKKVKATENARNDKKTTSDSNAEEVDDTETRVNRPRNNKSHKKGKLSIKTIGQGKYEIDGKTRAEDVIDDKILSKDAKTLSKDEQLAVLKKAGIKADDFEANEGEDGNVYLKNDNKFFRVVMDDNDIKIIQTVIENGEAQTKVFKMAQA